MSGDSEYLKNIFTEEAFSVLCPEALRTFAALGTELLVNGSTVYEKGLDPWHPDAFKGCGAEIEDIVNRKWGGDMTVRQEGWHTLDYWGNSIGFSLQAPQGARSLRKTTP